MSEQIKKILSNVAQSLSSTEQATARSNIGAQAQLTAGPNVDIINDVISTEKTVISAGSGVTVTSSQEPQTRVTTYEISSSGATYSAGNGLSLNGTTFSVNAANNGGLTVDSNGVGVYNKVPNSPGQYHYLRTSGPEHDDWYWEPLVKTKFTGQIRGHVLTAEDITNGYCDLQTDWGLPLAEGSPMEGHVPNHMTTSRFVFFLDMSDADYLNGTGSNGLSSQVDYIESGIWSESYPSFYACELFEPIQASEIVRVPGHPYFEHDVRKLGMSRLYVDFYGPAFRVHFAQNHVLQAGYTVSLEANVVGIYLPEIWF